jgi:diguanylate cyclase (GGDEF)-like protein/PAS domain S-box-containing protein
MSSKGNAGGPGNKISEELLQTVFIQAGDGIFLISDQSTIIEANPSGCEMLGFSRDEIIGLPLMNYVPSDEMMPLAEKLGRLATEKQVITESALLRKDGTRIEMEISARMLSNGQIVGLARNITSRIQSEQARRESAEKFRSLVEHSLDGIVIVDENGLIVEWNRGQEHITKMARADVLGKPIWEIEYLLMTEDLRLETTPAQMEQRIREILASGDGHEINQPRETTFHGANGVRHNVEIMTYTYQTSLGYRMGSIVRDITERKLDQQRIEYLATHDSLTNLPNRQTFQDRLELALDRALRKQRSILALMFLDIDHFKQVNDSYGHDCGDHLLKVTARRLQHCLRKSDTVARLSGDEFVIINEDVNSLENCEMIARKILTTLAEPVEFEGKQFQTSVSIGISLHSPENDDAATLLRQADTAMYSAKQDRNCFKFYHPESA